MRCEVSQGAGTMPDADVADVSVTCASAMHLLGGAVAGLPAGSTVTLALNGGAAGSFGAGSSPSRRRSRRGRATR